MRSNPGTEEAREILSCYPAPKLKSVVLCAYGKCVLLHIRDLSIDKVDVTVHIEEEDREFESVGINLLRFVKDLPQTLAGELTDNELSSLGTFIVETNYFFDKLDQLGKSNELARSAHADFNTAADHCMSGTSQYGLARWAALQACEKMLKCFIDSKNQPFPYTHNLSSLADIAYPLGLSGLEDDLLAKIQCAASIRYGEQTMTLSEVVDAIHSAIKVGHIILEAMQVRQIRCAFWPYFDSA